MNKLFNRLIKDLNVDMKVVDNLDNIQDGDILIIPSKNEAPKLRVGIGTYRKWGISIYSNGGYGCSYGRNNSSNVLNAFGRSWGGIYVFSDVTHNTNPDAGVVVNIDYANANSIGSEDGMCRMIYPLMNAVISPVLPAYPMKGNYPKMFSRARSGNFEAMDILISEIGYDSLPVESIQKNCHPDCPVMDNFLAIASKVLSEDRHYVVGGRHTRLLGKCSMERVRYDRDTESGADGLFMIGNGSDFFEDESSNAHENYANDYFKKDESSARSSSIEISKKFICNIVSRGALIVRSKDIHNIESRIMASRVAMEMHKRYSSVITAIKEMIPELENEVKTAERIAEKYKKAHDKLSYSEKEMKSIREIFV